MANILVHLNHDPEQPRRAELAFSVAKSAIDSGHKVTFILAGNPRQLLPENAPDNPSDPIIHRLRASYDAVVASGVKIYLSDSPGEPRASLGVEGSGKPVFSCIPAWLSQLAVGQDRVFTY